jgi:hypothetical protein
VSVLFRQAPPLLEPEQPRLVLLADVCGCVRALSVGFGTADLGLVVRDLCCELHVGLDDAKGTAW